MSKVKWNVEAQMVEVWHEEDHFLLHPYLEVSGMWTMADLTMRSKGYILPTSSQLTAMHNLKREIDKVILDHFGSMLKDNDWHWTRVRTEDYGYDVVHMHNGHCRTLYDPGKYIGRAVLDMND